MASRNLGTLTIDLIAKIGGFTKGMTEAERTADKKTREMKKKMAARAEEVSKAWEGISTAVAAAVTGLTVGAAFQKIISESIAAQNEQALLAAALKSTGNSAGYSQERLNDMADAMEGITAISAGEFNQAQTVLLGFTNIVGDKLPQALQAAADFSTRTGADMAAAAETVGRALDIPSAGMASLQRQGFKFSESQIEAAKQLEQTGRLAEAQQIVLDALSETYGGAAVAARDTLGGAHKALQNTINSLLTGEGGSIQQLQHSLDNLNGTLSSEQTRAAFAAYTSWLADLANTAVKTTAVLSQSSLWGWMQVGKDDADDVNGAITETERKIAVLQDTVRSMSRPLFRFFEADNIVIANGQISTLQAKLQTLYAMRDQEKPPERSVDAPALAPDLPVRTVGAVNLKDGAAKGKSQADKDEEAAKRFLQSLREQVVKTQERTAYEKLFFDLQNKELKLSDAQLDQAVGLVTAIDMAKELQKQKAEEVQRQNALYEVQSSLLNKRNQYELELATYGLGAKAAAEMRERIGLLEQYRQTMAKLQQDQANAMAGAKTDDEAAQIQGQFEERLRLTQEALDEELSMYDRYIEQKRAKEADWQAGAMSGLQTYLENSRNVYEQTQQVVLNAFGSMEDTLVNFVKTGKLDMQSLFASIAEDVLRMLVRMGVQMVANKLLGDTLQAAGVATAAVAGTATAAAWAPAAAMASLASFGANAAPATAGMASTLALGKAMALFGGFAEGGYTGPGGKYQPAGIVHAGEGVLSQADMAALGGPAAFEQFRRALHSGYAAGGVVGAVPAAQPSYMARYEPVDRPGTSVQVIEDASRAGTTERSVSEQGEEIIQVFVANIRRGGQAAQALEAAYGLERRGR